jgi:N6-L-threonylcarbamoyladenine synthase
MTRLILGIETSCDETSVALVEDGRRVVVQSIASQTPLHERFGGVVPEVASRAHLRLLLPQVGRVLDSAGLGPEAVDGIAVTAGPGLVGALLVGVETAKALSLAWNKPVVGVHHGAGHLLSVGLEGAGPTLMLNSDGELDLADSQVAADHPQLLDPSDPTDPSDRSDRTDQKITSGKQEVTEPAPWSGREYPYLGLIVSGGHTSLIAVNSGTTYRRLGETIDDAAGECLDKVAKVLGLGFPGGPALERTARDGNPQRYALPRPLGRSGDLRFSFSGLKTAVLTLIRDLGGPDAVAADAQVLADVCASTQEAVAASLAGKCAAALESSGLKRLALVGGVACNSAVRTHLARVAAQCGAQLRVPPPILCTDNAAMIARVGWELLQSGAPHGHGLGFDARAEWPIEKASNQG